ncbi:MAG: hypothetical protein ABH849_02615 [Nanoarchaeota archaeon]
MGIDNFDTIKPILRKIIPKLKEDLSKINGWSTSDNGNLSYMIIEQAVGNHMLEDGREKQFGISEQDAQRLRDYVQSLGGDRNWGDLKMIYETFGDYLDGELDWRMEEINYQRGQRDLPRIDIPMRKG